MFVRLSIITSLFFLSVSNLFADSSASFQVPDENIPDLMVAGDHWEYKNGDQYSGLWLHNQPHGQGVYKRNNGDLFEGHFLNGEAYGQGTYQFENGDVYQGEWVKGMASGSGELRYRNGNLYEGQWANGVRDGEGVLTYRSGSVYKGQWSNGEKSGEGMMVYRNGERYIGDYKRDQPHGHGVKTSSDGETYRGTFSKGVPHGVGECNRPGGDIHICLFSKGNRVTDAAKLKLAQAYYERNRPVYEYNGGMAYHLQDEYTKARLYVTTLNVWWEKTVAMLETQLRIRSEDDDQFLSLVVNRYKGPGVYQLRRGEILAATIDGNQIDLLEDEVANIEIMSEDNGIINGRFSILRMASDTQQGERQFRIYDGRFEAASEPPEADVVAHH